jgi:excisionase family DNA binding protein
MIMEKFWTTEEVAAMLRVNGSTIRRWRLDDVGPRFVKVGNVYRYPDSELREWIRQRVEGRRAA